MSRVIHFEIGADDPERAVKFYEKVFGWKINRWGPVEYWLATTGPDAEPGINGAITPRVDKRATVNTISVPNVDEFVKRIEQEGGKIVMAKSTVPGVGYMAYCQDTEGNIFGIMQEDPSAK
jgi:hypothetical protein